MTKIDYIRVIQDRLFMVFGLLGMHPNAYTELRDLQRSAELLNEIKMLLEGDDYE